MVRPEGTVELYNRLATKDRQIELIPNAEHLIFEEGQFTDREVEIVNNWLSSHLASKGNTTTDFGSKPESPIKEKSDESKQE